MSVPTTLAQLRALGWSDLDRLYIDSPPGPVPTGAYKGKFLVWLPPAKKLINLPFVTLEAIGFQLLPWGIDFRCSEWWVGAKIFHGGLFSPTEGPSRWRPTKTWQMHYDRDWFPYVRWCLYDEVKSLTPDICLGIGGINGPEGIGDHFYYSLHRE